MRALLAILFLALVADVGPAGAQQSAPPVCAPWQSWRSQLKAGYGELPRARFIANNGALVEIYVDPDDGSVTVIVINPMTGIACGVIGGEGWHLVPYPDSGGPA